MSIPVFNRVDVDGFQSEELISVDRFVLLESSRPSNGLLVTLLVRIPGWGEQGRYKEDMVGNCDITKIDCIRKSEVCLGRP